MASLLTGSWPAIHGGGQKPTGRPPTATALHADLPTLAERFQAAGFGTGAVVSNAFLAPTFGVDRGFASYDYQTSTMEHTRRADEVVRTGLEWIERQGEQPFLLLLHFFDPHLGYDAPPEFRGRFSAQIESSLELPVTQIRALRRNARRLPDAERRFVRAAYDEELAGVDAQLGILLDALEKQGFLEHSLVVLTADHGEEFFEHAGFEHGHALWQELLHVPLAFWGVGVVPGREPAPVSLVDLAPTLLDATGLEPLPEAQGTSLWPNLVRGAPLGARPLYAESLLYGRERKAVIQWPDKLVFVPSTGEWRHYQLERDPGERLPGPLPQTEEIERLRSEAVALWQRGAEKPPQPVAPLDDTTRDALKGLGYLE
jgi:arylsulfatase A-like enzyme